jgi:hypothetical protein
MLAVNSAPLSLCKIFGAPKRRKISKICIATSDKMIKEANKKYANVSIEALELFKELCEECQLKKRKLASKGLVVKPIVSKEFNSRGQMYLIDM